MIKLTFVFLGVTAVIVFCFYFISPFFVIAMIEALIVFVFLYKQFMLFQSERHFRILSTLAPVGLFDTDIHGHYSYVNQKLCDITGLSASDLKGRGWEKSVHPEDCLRVVSSWYRAVKSGTDFFMEHRYQSLKGKTTVVYVQAIPFKNKSGKILGYIGTVLDITEHKSLEDQLRQPPKDRNNEEQTA